MKINQIIYTLATLSLLTACSDDLLSPTHTVGEANNAITLRAGINEGSTGVQTRAAEDHHTTPGHKTLTQGTKLRLRVDGTWLGKDNYTLPHGKVTNTAATQTTTATVGAETATDSKHNNINFGNNTLYWDDYGTADPANRNTPNGTVTNGTGGREKGLTIYGVAVSGKALPSSTTEGRTDLTTFTDWQNIEWNVGKPSTGTPAVIDQSTNGWGDYDLITSNNIRESGDGTYKFDDFMHYDGSSTPSDILEFTHAMSKVTVVLTAGEGFTIPSGGNAGTFKEVPTVTLLGFNYMGKVDVEGKTSTATKSDGTEPTSPDPAATANIKMHLDNGGKDNHTATFDALVFPGNKFTANIADDAENTASSNDPLLELNADGNIYKVTAAQLVKAIAKKDNNNVVQTGNNIEKTLVQGVNYILNINVNKTKIDVTATIKDWVDVSAANEAPKINIVTNYGDPTTGGSNPNITAFTKDYTFLRSLNDVSTSPASDINKGYTDNRWMKYQSSAYKMYDEASGNTESPLYWPDHSSHYFFRGVYPRLGSTSAPTITQITDNSVTYNVIEVSNEKYNHVDNGGHCPTDLLIAYPHPYENTNDNYATKCRHNQEIETNGICATEGKIVMNFEHAMSQVEVKLTTNTAAGATNAVTFDANTKVEIIGGYTSGYILLKDGSANFSGKSTDNYIMNREYASDNAKYNTDYLDAIIPQSLVAADGTTPTLKFKITVRSTNGTGDQNLDSYETVLGIKDIAIQGGNKIDKWEPGKKYIYTLNITKTGIVSEATIKDWEEVVASEDVWF